VLLDGYVNAVGRESRILPSSRGPFREQVVPKTFEKALQSTDDVELRFNHDENRKLGSTKLGNLQLYEDSIGLRAIATVTDEEVMEKAKAGKLTGWSFSFVDQKPNWQDGSDGIQKRYLEDIELLEVSILDKTPAYIATSIEARGEENVITENRSDEFRAMIEDLTPAADQTSEKIVCPACGKEITDNTAAYCSECGEKLNDVGNESNEAEIELLQIEIEILKLKGGNNNAI
jgi:hypothetical protein